MGAEIVTPEMFEIVDIRGNSTGEVLEKSIVHQLGLRHRDVHVWVTDGEHVLEQQRVWDKAIMPGEWDISVGGHVAAGETFLDTAVRETREELGLDVPPKRFIPAPSLAAEVYVEAWDNYHRVFGGNFVVVDKNLSLAALTLRAKEVSGARLYPIDQLEVDLQHPETARRHAPHPRQLWLLGIAAMRGAIA